MMRVDIVLLETTKVVFFSAVFVALLAQEATETRTEIQALFIHTAAWQLDCEIPVRSDLIKYQRGQGSLSILSCYTPVAQK